MFREERDNLSGRKERTVIIISSDSLLRGWGASFLGNRGHDP